MPRQQVRISEWQDALFETRWLYSPGAAGERLSISRQAVHASADRPGGRVLMWEFVNRRLPERDWEKYADFGPKDGPEDETEWVREGGPEKVLEWAVKRYSMFQGKST